MNKEGIFSGIVMFLALFLITATIIYSGLSIEAEKTTSKIEAIRNYNFNVQIASNYANKAFTEAIYDQIYTEHNPPWTGCSLTITDVALQTKYDSYLHNNSKVNFGPCKILNQPNIASAPVITITDLSSGTFVIKQFSATVLVSCSQLSEETILDYNKSFTFYKRLAIFDNTSNCPNIYLYDTNAQEYYIPLVPSTPK